MIIVYDTETNGKIKDYSLPCEVVDNFPRLSQLSYKIFNESGECIKTFDKFILPDGWDFPDEQFFKDHADINKNKTLGIPVKQVLQEYIEDALKCHFSVAHNIGFDSKIIRAEIIRAGLSVEFTAKKLCTMNKSTKYCQIPALNGRKGIKWPTLTELHNKLFKCDFEGAHGSMADVDACSKCLFELIRLKVIELDKI